MLHLYIGLFGVVDGDVDGGWVAQAELTYDYLDVPHDRGEVQRGITLVVKVRVLQACRVVSENALHQQDVI